MNQVSSIDAAPALAVPATRSAGRERIQYIEYFRALAIIFIVTGHVFVLAWTHFADEDPTVRITLLNVVPALINSGTAYFVFISGFLYRHVFHGRMAFGEFMRRKALYIGLPYLIIGSALALAEIASGAFSVTVFKEGEPYPPSPFIDYAVLMVTGRMANAYWYMPFIFLVFLASPLFDRFIRLKPGYRTVIFVLAFGLALWVHRPLENLNPLHSFLYFANLYMAGMLFWEYRHRIMEVVTRPTSVALLTLLILAIAAVQAVILDDTSNIERGFGDGWAPLGFDLMLIQKYVGIFLFCGAFALWGHRIGGFLSYIANRSFGVYFVHAIVIAVMMRLPQPLSPHTGEPITDMLVYSVVVMALSLALVEIFRWATGSRSRYIIGC
jgi:surface polysaccharide O-acyltransferase-like enzyme